MPQYNRPQVPTIQVGDDSSFDPTKMLLGLASQIATKVISDQFYYQRREKITEDTQELTNIHESMEYIRTLNDPILIKEEADKIGVLLSTGKSIDGDPFTEEEKTLMLTKQTALLNRHGYLTSDRQKYLNQLAGDVGEWKALFANMSVSNDPGYKDVDFLEKQQTELRGLMTSIEASEGYRTGAPFDILSHEQLQGYDTLLEQQLKMANALKDWDVRINQYGDELDKVQGDQKEYLGKAAIYIKDLNDYLVSQSAFLDVAHDNQLDEMRDDIRMISQGYHFDNLIDKIRLSEDFTSPEGIGLLDLADELITSGIANKNKQTIAQGISTVKQATLKEFVADRIELAAELKEKKTFAGDTEQQLKSQANVIADKFGKGNAGKEFTAALSPTYKAGPLAVQQNPEHMLLKYTGSEQNMIQLKVIYGQNISKLVKGSDLYDDDENVKEIIDATLTGTGDFVKADELYDLLDKKWTDEWDKDEPDKGLDLDFTGRDPLVFGADSDTAAKELLKEYLLLYEILRKRHEEAIGTFGPEYGYGKVKTQTSYQDRPHAEEEAGIQELLNKMLYP